ncbi:transmembrane protein, putative (macronuclear) [Tetrahymena thermophila SB210]|uniref:Transmembrane protein, putative n=1 Tax=Tetrahymena thermophila (strain SB210) TaxID=312017 RepID=Q237K0_TETTS|nr:transmembrane protein, putative [Tetrahymena thermophila SB210]EAR92741.2 transmembrane protein, putative [Tetrahymena thermophila SB210]|eukprot:XP_001012986.2 transmembrane protein, putative [Tetrahymena thermophila SB210]
MIYIDNLKTNMIYQQIVCVLFFIILNLKNVFANQVIYNPLPIIDINTQQYGRYIYSTTVIEDYPQVLVSVFLQESLALFDLSQNCQLFAIYNHTVQQAISRGSFLYFITQDHQMIIQKYIPASSSNIDNYHQYLINVNIYQNTSFAFNSLYVDSNQKYLYIGCFGYLIILDVSNKLNIQEIAFVSVTHDFTYWITLIEDQYVLLSNYYSNILIFDISDIQRPVLFRKLDQVGSESVQTYFFQNQKILYSLSFYYFLQITDLSLLFQNKTQFQTMDEKQFVQGIFNIQSSYVINSMFVSTDENYLFLTIRSNGFLIYDISNTQFKMSPQFLINVNSFGFSTFIQTAGINDRYIVFSEGISLKIYEKTTPNTSQTVINIFNLDQCILVNSFKEMWPWSIIYIENKYLVVTAGFTGFQIHDMTIPLMPQLTFKDKRENASYDCSLYLAKRKILLIGQSEKGIAFYNTTLSYSSPTFILSKIYSANPDTDSFVSNSDENILAFVDEKSFGFIDLTDIQNTFVIDSVQLPPTESRSLEGIAMDENFLYGCSALRNRGVYYFKFDYPEGGKNTGKKIQIINFVELYGAESVIYDKRNNGIFYVADGVSGVTVLDSSDKTRQIQLVSTNSVLGWAGRVFQPDGNLNILIVSHHDRGSISVMDISNQYQIIKIQEMQFIPSGSFASVTDLQNSFLAITVTNGFRICQTNSPINLHAQMIRSKDKQSSENLIDIFNPFISSQKVNNQIVAKIGESVSFTIVPLYYFQGIQYKSLLQYDQYQTKQIPSWITFQPFTQTINMVPQYTYISSYQGFCILLLDIYLQIFSNQFISPQFNITKEHSSNLYDYFIQQGILSQDGFLSSTYDPLIRFKIDWQQIYTNNDVPSNDNLSRIYDYVKLTVDRSTFYYPIFIRILQSLNLNFTNAQGIIETYSSQVMVQISLVFEDPSQLKQQNRPQFIPQTFNGILSDLKNQNLQLDLRGIVTSVNNILKDQIYIYIPKYIQERAMIQFFVRDEINADLQKTVYLSEIPQFKQKAPLLSLLSIQEQYEQQYPGGLFVEQTFSININQNSFKSEAFLQIKYQVLISDGMWRNLTSSDWISFENNGQNLYLTGKGSLSDLQKSFSLQVIATDEFENNTQTLVVTFCQIPLTIILLYVGYLLIIIFFIIFFYCIRQKIHHRFFPSQFQRKLEKIYYKNHYFKKIYLMKDFHAISTKLIYLLKQDYIQKNKKNLSYFQQIKSQIQKSPKRSNSLQLNNVKQSEMLFLQQYIDDQGLPNMNKIILDLVNIYNQNISKFQKLNSSEFNQTNSRLYQAIKSVFTLRILETDKQTLEIFLILKKTLKQKTQNALNWYQQLIEIQSEKEQYKQHSLKSNLFQIRQLTKDLKLTQNNQSKQQLEDITKVQNLSLNNQTNLTLTQPSQQLMHNKTQSNLNYLPSNVFLMPEIKLNEEALISQISQIYKKYNEQGLKLLIQNESGSFYNFQLLKSAILSEFYGFGQNYKPKRFKSSHGSVIHLSQNQIKDIKIFLKDSEQDQKENGIFYQICSKIKSILFFNYKKIGQNFHSAQNIRNWLRYQINENYIILQGEPQKLNVGEYLIQILNSDKYVTYQYSLQVVLNKQEAHAPSQIKQKSKKLKEANQSKNLQKSVAYQKQSIFLQSQEKIEPPNSENQIQDEQQSNIILKTIQLKIPQSNYFSEVKLQKTEEINNSSILSYNLNKTVKKDDDLESSSSTFEIQKRFSFDKSYAQIIPYFGENIRKEESYN